jgi:hypothetical protein
MNPTSKKDRRIRAVSAATHRANVLAAAAADRHARDFTVMFSISAPVQSMKPSTSYLASLAS